jgi:peptide/nickel transport system permease protein
MDKRRWGAVMIGIILALTVLGYFYTPYDPNEVRIAQRFAPPSLRHPFGTDHFGRDVLSRILVGGGVSLVIGLAAVSLGSACGVTLGLLAGFRGGFGDELFMRISTALQAFPSILWALLLASVWEPGIPVLVCSITIGNIPNFLRVTRSQVLSIRKRPYVEAARALGLSDLRIMVRHIVPNLLDALMVQFTVSLAGAILVEASLSYLGIGLQPPYPSWGRILREAQPHADLAPWLVLVPGLFIAITVIGFNLLGDNWIFGREEALIKRIQ